MYTTPVHSVGTPVSGAQGWLAGFLYRKCTNFNWTVWIFAVYVIGVTNGKKKWGKALKQFALHRIRTRDLVIMAPPY